MWSPRGVPAPSVPGLSCLLLLLVACDGKGEDTATPYELSSDRDGDGVLDDDDCAPDNASVYPGAAEACNGRDDDCDEQVDEGVDVPLWYLDMDGDGAAGPTTGLSCEPPPGAQAEPTDCDDTRVDVAPGLDEWCDGRDNDCDGATDEAESVDATTWYYDEDGDGYGDAAGKSTTACEAPATFVADATDCDDAHAAAHPGGTEVCDDEDVDEDCDGLVDAEDPDAAGTTTVYRDGDGDGFGGEAVASCDGLVDGTVDNTLDCDDADATAWPGAPVDCASALDHDCDGRPDNFDADGDGSSACDDCDDADPEVNPAAPESCDGQDNNCDGLIDGDDAVDATTWYRDADNDRWGDPTEPFLACEQPRGYRADAGDCDDDNSDIHPGATERCRTEEDDDCDGSYDAVDASGCTTFYVDADGDGFGETSTGVCTCEQPDEAHAVTLSGDCEDGDDTIHPEAEEICLDGLDQDCSGDDLCDQPEEAFVVAESPTMDDSFFGDMTAGGDVTGDGNPDIVAGGLRSGSAAGLVFVWGGPLSAPVGDPVAVISGSTEDRYMGRVLGIADADGDGDGDLMTASNTSYNGTSSSSGRVHLFEGPLSGERLGDSAELTIEGDPSDGLGWTADIGHDLDGDGVPELSAGGFVGSNGGYLGVPVTERGLVSPGDASWRVEGSSTSGFLGHSMILDDFDGDGQDDLLYGMYSWGDRGGFAVRLGPVSGSNAAEDFDAVYENDLGSYVGTWSSRVGDVSGDGLPDLGLEGDEAYMLWGGYAAGTHLYSEADATLAGMLGYREGPAVGADVDGDGALELVVATEVADDSVMVFEAPVSGVLGPMDADWGVAMGYGPDLAPVGDVDADGRIDLVVSDSLHDASSGGGGGVWLLPGSVLP